MMRFADARVANAIWDDDRAHAELEETIRLEWQHLVKCLTGLVEREIDELAPVTEIDPEQVDAEEVTISLIRRFLVDKWDWRP